MARVCQGWFPHPDPKQAGFWMDDYLKIQLDVLIKNVKNDWDFTILISARGEMRAGKSVLEMQIMAYWTYEVNRLYNLKVPFTVQQNIAFNGNELIPKGMALGKEHKYAALGYDEAADDMESSKVMKGSTQMIKDYLRKAAQFNMLTVIVQAEFFELPKPLAVSRSICLIDVQYGADEEGMFQRGMFNFYSRRSKKMLYILGKKYLDYSVVKPDFKGYFHNFYPLNEQEYKDEKRKALFRWERQTASDIRRSEWLKAMIIDAHAKGLTYREIAEIINNKSKVKIVHTTVGRILAGESLTDEDWTI